MIQSYTQTQRNLSPSDFSMKTGPSETTQRYHLRLASAREFALDDTLSMLRFSLLRRRCCLYSM
jgi:hypothetical protein